jgi:hypothetical protein
MKSDPVLDPEPDPDPLVRGTDPGILIRIRTKMSGIPNTDFWGWEVYVETLFYC